MSTPESMNLQGLFDQCWSDDEFLAHFLQDPIAVLLERKLMDMRGMDVEVAEYKANRIHLIFHGDSPDKIHIQSQRHPRIADGDA